MAAGCRPACALTSLPGAVPTGLVHQCTTLGYSDNMLDPRLKLGLAVVARGWLLVRTARFRSLDDVHC